MHGLAHIDQAGHLEKCIREWDRQVSGGGKQWIAQASPLLAGN